MDKKWIRGYFLLKLIVGFVLGGVKWVYLGLKKCLFGATHKLVDQANPNRGLIYLTVVGNIVLYSYAATYGINCVYDNSEPKVYQAKVIDKSISRGRRHTTYYLRVEPWGHHRDAENISVAPSQYSETTIGQTVSIDYKEGLLGIPWYYVE